MHIWITSPPTCREPGRLRANVLIQTGIYRRMKICTLYNRPSMTPWFLSHIAAIYVQSPNNYNKSFTFISALPLFAWMSILIAETKVAPITNGPTRDPAVSHFIDPWVGLVKLGWKNSLPLFTWLNALGSRSNTYTFLAHIISVYCEEILALKMTRFYLCRLVDPENNSCLVESWVSITFSYIYICK